MRLTNLVILFLVIHMIGCQAKRINNQISFEKVQQLLPGNDTQEVVSRKLGSPTQKELNKSSQLETWLYDDQKSGYQRLTITFSENKKILSILWLPHSGEPEADLEFIKGKFSQNSFTQKTIVSENPHTIEKSINYTSEKHGMSLLVEGAKETVVGIAFYDKSMRAPTNDETKTPPFTDYLIGK